MVDSVSPEKRSWIMSRIRGKDTLPEMRVRQAAHGLGFRFRLHTKEMPGTPDLVFPRLGKIILVHGCFWHGHRCKGGRRIPRSNQEYWIAKIRANKLRDARTRRRLRGLGWKVLVVWECQTSDPEILRGRLFDFLDA
ncbi:MAG: DNA mismatch endonuclease Vsr [Holophagaceae bacterium]|nr:DNA mismatch endonuclease Vsr [Holophagaceae bacterium]